MGKRKKRLEKQIRGLEKQVEKHKEKVETLKGRKDTTPDYVRNPHKFGFLNIPKLTRDTQEFCDWRAEIELFEKRKREREEILKRLRRVRSE